MTAQVSLASANLPERRAPGGRFLGSGPPPRSAGRILLAGSRRSLRRKTDRLQLSCISSSRCSTDNDSFAGTIDFC